MSEDVLSFPESVIRLSFNMHLISYFICPSNTCCSFHPFSLLCSFSHLLFTWLIPTLPLRLNSSILSLFLESYLTSPTPMCFCVCHEGTCAYLSRLEAWGRVGEGGGWGRAGPAVITGSQCLHNTLISWGWNMLQVPSGSQNTEMCSSVFHQVKI